jgi:hypothetical protein
MNHCGLEEIVDKTRIVQTVTSAELQPRQTDCWKDLSDSHEI